MCNRACKIDEARPDVSIGGLPCQAFLKARLLKVFMEAFGVIYLFGDLVLVTG